MFSVQAPGSDVTHRFEDPNFLFSSLQANAVLRWEYLPGSSLFLIYQLSCDATQSRGTGRFDPSAYLRPCDGARPQHTAMAKLTYWFSR